MSRGNPTGANQHVGGKSGNTANSLSAERNTKAQILRRLARERPDLLERYERGEISANAAAIEAGFRKPPKPRPTTPAEVLDMAAERMNSSTPPGIAA